jgi:hypothetical protein
MKTTDDKGIKLVKASTLKDVLIFVLKFKQDNPDQDLYSEIVKYLKETIASLE